MSSCANCSQPLQPQSNYCSQCGQSIVNFQKPIKPVFTGMIHESLDIDGRIILSLKTLLFKPGILSLEYNAGKRMKYTPPLRMYLVISILFFLLLSQLEFDSIVAGESWASRSEYYSKIMFVLVPIYALFLQILFRRTFYLSNLIFAIHMHCFTYLIFAIMFPLEVYEKVNFIFVALQFPLFIYYLIYSALALKRFYAQDWIRTLGKLTILLLAYAVLIMLSLDFVLSMR